MHTIITMQSTVRWSYVKRDTLVNIGVEVFTQKHIVVLVKGIRGVRHTISTIIVHKYHRSCRG